MSGHSPGSGSHAGRVVGSIARSGGLWLLVTWLVTLAAAWRIGRIDPGVARAGTPFDSLAAFALAALVVLAAAALLAPLVERSQPAAARAAARLGARLRKVADIVTDAPESGTGGTETPTAGDAPAPPVSSTDAIVAWISAPILLAGAWLAPGLIRIPLRAGGASIAIPLFSPDAGQYLMWATGGLAIEWLLAGAWLLSARGRRWWIARAILGAYWIGFLAAMIGGPNLLLGEPLEWAKALGRTRPTQAWLNHAPRVPGQWWPALQAGLAGAIVVTLFRVVQEARQVVRPGPRAPAR